MTQVMRLWAGAARPIVSRMEARFTRLVSTLILALALCGCFGKGTVLVEHAVRLEVEVRDESGAMLPAGEVREIERPPKISIAFDSHEYRDADIEWTVGGLGGTFVNRAPEVQCLRYDQARISSNMHPEPVALNVFFWALHRDGRLQTIGSTAPKEQVYFTPPSLCLRPGEKVFLMAWTNVGTLFPNGRRFNTSEPEGEQLFIADKGVGNWVRMQLPVEIGQRRRTIDMKQTALDAKARVSYY